MAQRVALVAVGAVLVTPTVTTEQGPTVITWSTPDNQPRNLERARGLKVGEERSAEVGERIGGGTRNPPTTEAAIKHLVVVYGCWAGDIQAPTQPQHAIVTRRDGTTVRSSHVHKALESVFDTPIPGYTVHAFCP